MIIKVLIADDSAFARKVLREVLSASSEIEVVGVARDGLETLERIHQLKPDVVALDLVMPHLDGVGVLRALAGAPSPRVVLVTAAGEQSELAIDALTLGAVDLVNKPTTLATDRLYELGPTLIAKILAAAGARPLPPAMPAAPAATPPRHADVDLVAIGASTGGPQAIGRLLAMLPEQFPVPIVIAVHMPSGFTTAMAKRLDAGSALRVLEATDGLVLEPSVAVIAPGGKEIRIARQGSDLVVRLTRAPGHRIYTPSLDVLFESAATACGERLLAVVMTGMGDDGLIGARAIHAAGGRLLTEAESSAVVYGMPRCVQEAGIATAQGTLEEMTDLIVRHLTR